LYIGHGGSVICIIERINNKADVAVEPGPTKAITIVAALKMPNVTWMF
jgi:hypothetical protein